MVGNSELCECPDSQSSVEFACNCSDKIVYLCNKCIADHVRQPNSHVFISLEQSRDLRNAEISQKQTDIAVKNQKIDDSFQVYTSKIIDFTSRVKYFKSKIAQAVDQACNLHIDFLEKLLDLTQSRWSEVSKQLEDPSSSNSDIFSRYESQGLAGLIDDYYQELILYEEDVIESVKNMIYFGSEKKTSSTQDFLNKIQDLTHTIDALKKENDELKTHLHKYTPQPIYDQPILQEMKDMSYEDLKMRFHYTLKDRALVEFDKLLKSYRNFDLSQFLITPYDEACCILLPDRRIIIIAQRNSIYRFDPTNYSIMRLQGLNKYRTRMTLHCIGNYLYAFGGLDSRCNILKTAERMDWRKNGWEKLPNMIRENTEVVSYSLENSIYLIGGFKNYVQRYDILDNKYTEHSHFKYAPYSGSVREIEGLLYMVIGGDLIVMNKPCNVIGRYIEFERNGNLYSVNKGLEMNRNIVFSFDEWYIRFHKSEEQEFKIIKQVLFLS